MQIKNLNKRIVLYILIISIIWVIAIVIFLKIAQVHYHPILKQETIGTGYDLKTEPLYSGDSVTQSFTSSYDALNSVAIAMSYEDTISPSTTLLVEVFRNDVLLVNQPLIIHAFPKGTFVKLQLNSTECLNDSFKVVITNTSATTDSDAVFSVMKTLVDVENLEPYTQNGIVQNGFILFQTTYETGHNYYELFTYLIWIVITSLITTAFAKHLILRMGPEHLPDC